MCFKDNIVLYHVILYLFGNHTQQSSELTPGSVPRFHSGRALGNLCSAGDRNWAGHVRQKAEPSEKAVLSLIYCVVCYFGNSTTLLRENLMHEDIN